MKVPMRPIIQALEFHISAVLVNPAKGALNFGSTFGNSTYKFHFPKTHLGSINFYAGTNCIQYFLLRKGKKKPRKRTYPCRKLGSLDLESDVISGGSDVWFSSMKEGELRILMVNCWEERGGNGW